MLQRNIRLRNPYVDPIHLLQIDLLRRWREGGRGDDQLLDALKASVNGIALADSEYRVSNPGSQPARGLCLNPAPVQYRLGVSTGLFTAQENEITGCLEGHAIFKFGRHVAIGRVSGVLFIDDPRIRSKVSLTSSSLHIPWCSQLAICWLEMRRVARSSIRPT